MIQLVPLERIKDQIVEQIVAVLVPRIKEDIVEVTQPVLQERVQNRVGEQIWGVPVPQIKEDLVDGVPVLPQERVQSRFTRSVCGCASALCLLERVQERIVEQISVVPQTTEKIVSS